MEGCIKIKTLGRSRAFKIQLDTTLDTIHALRIHLCQRLKWNLNDFQLILNGKKVQDEEYIQDILYLHEMISAKNTSLVVWAILYSTAKTTVVFQVPRRMGMNGNAKYVAVEMESCRRIHQVKQLLYDQGYSELKPNAQSLIVCGKIVQNHTLLGEHVNGTVLKPTHMIVRKNHAQPKDIRIKIRLVGGDHFPVVVNRTCTVQNVKSLLLRSGAFSHFGNLFTLFEASSRRPLTETQTLIQYDVKDDDILLAVPSLEALSGSMPPSMATRLSSFSLVDIFFPPESVKERKMGNKKTSSASFLGLRRGFISETCSDNNNLSRNTKKGGKRPETAVFRPRRKLEGPQRKKRIVEGNQSEAQAVSEKEVLRPIQKSPKEVLMCACCSRRLSTSVAIAGKCRCGQILCSTHIHKHECTYEYKRQQVAQQTLDGLNQQISSLKITRI